jgi:hypothetical protein
MHVLFISKTRGNLTGIRKRQDAFDHVEIKKGNQLQRKNRDCLGGILEEIRFLSKEL